MRNNLIAAILAGGCVLGVQASAFAQGAAAYPNTAPVLTEPTPIAPEARPGAYVRVPAQPYYDQYNGQYTDQYNDYYGDNHGQYRRQSR
jgi:hypothetical protein